MKTVKEVIQYFENLYMSSAVYLWGANGETITPALVDKLFKAYGNATYNQKYYSDKLAEGLGRIGADCSGAFCPVSGFDSTAQGYYSKCTDKGLIGQIDRNKACLVFKGNASNKITHIGFYLGDGNVIEMKSSKDNCVKAPLDGHGWKFYGVPTWIDYGNSTDNQMVAKTATAMNLGVDLSANQGNVDFQKLKKAGISFVILRTILKSGKVDTMFHTYLSGAESTGMRTGVYIYSYDRTDLEAIVSAEEVVNLLNGRRLPIFLDLENAEQRNAIGKAGITKVANAFIQTCRKHGYDCYIYCNLDWYKNVIDDSLKPYAVWIARYGANDGTINLNYKPNVGEKIWQYSSKGKVDGINGDVDVDICYDMSIFDGSTVTSGTAVNSPYTLTSINVLGKVTASSLNIRKEPTTNSAIVGGYKNGDIIPLLGLVAENGWYKTDKGYVSGKYVVYLQGKVDNCTALNVRKHSNASSEIVTTINRGTVFIIMNRQNDWYNIILSENLTGWVSSKYVTLI